MSTLTSSFYAPSVSLDSGMPGWMSVMAEAVRQWRSRRRMAAELAGLSDRDLADFGASRTDIDRMLAGQAASEGRRS